MIVTAGMIVDRAVADAKRRVKPATLKKYRRAAVLIKRQIADLPIQELTGTGVFRILDHYRHKPAAANHVHTLLRLSCRHAVQAGFLEHNPVLDVPRFRQGARTRYITHPELNRIWRNALMPLPIVIDICYLTAQRISDVLSIEMEQITDAGGISFRQQKTGVRLIVEAPELPAVIRRAKRWRKNNRSEYLICNRVGLPYEYPSIYRLWRQACQRADVKDANLHDIRAKSVTDAEQEGLDPTALAGHTNSAQTRRYLRGRSIKTVTGPHRA